MMVMTFWGAERFREKHLETDVERHHDFHPTDDGAHGVLEPHESPWVMTVPLIVLAVLSTLGGFIGVPYALGSLVSDHPVNYIEQVLAPVISPVPAGGPHAGEPGTVGEIKWLSPEPQLTDGASPVHALEGSTATGSAEHAHSPEEIRLERLLALVSVLIAASGIAAGWFMFRRRPLLQMPRILENKYHVDEIYDAAIINPIVVGSSEGLWKLFDQGVIDGFLHSVGDAVTESGRLIRHLQGGFVRAYAAIILIGALVIIGFFAYFGVGLLALAP
jgi:NADH-quinone oxidoreductase subunit L